MVKRHQTIKEKYNQQRRHCRQRGIEFQFTYEEWLAWWGEDIVNRGRQRGQLVMARHGDTGPYHPDNVRKATCSDNIKESNIKNKTNVSNTYAKGKSYVEMYGQEKAYQKIEKFKQTWEEKQW